MIRKTFASLLPLVLATVFSGCSPKPAATPSAQPEVSAEQKSVPPPPSTATSAPTTPAPAPEPPKPAGPTSIRIVAWNLEWFPGQKPEPTPDAEIMQMEAAKSAVGELNPDVLLLEEVRDWESADKLCAVNPELKVQVVSRFQPRPQNQVIASKYPVDSGWSESWQHDFTELPRGYVFAAVELPDHRYLLTYALHLKSNLGDFATSASMRQASAKQLLKHASEMLATYRKLGPCAIVIGGDMNTSLDDPKFAEDRTLGALIKAGYHWTHEGVPFAERTTIPGSNGFPDNCFDHIFTAGLGKPVAAVRAFPGISDHNPVVLEVDLTKADFQPKLEADAGISFLGQSTIVPPLPGQTPPTVATPIEATDVAALTAAVGKIATVKGRIQKVGNTGTQTIYFINFTGVPRGGFVAIVRKDNLDAVAGPLGGDLGAALNGKNVEITGQIVLFKDAPQIAVKEAKQIKLTE